MNHFNTGHQRILQHAVIAAIACLSSSAWSADATPARDDAALAAKAVALFGKQPGQTFNAKALAPSATAPRIDTMAITLAPGKGAEVKALVEAGQGFVFNWTATGDVLFDLHGETPQSKDEYTSYEVDVKKRQGSGTFVAPFAGHHGWFWQNQGKEPVTIQVTVTGFQKSLFRPGKP